MRGDSEAPEARNSVGMAAMFFGELKFQSAGDYQTCRVFWDSSYPIDPMLIVVDQ
jgi:hypothetical protein